jgi:hypothetical protein
LLEYWETNASANVPSTPVDVDVTLPLIVTPAKVGDDDVNTAWFNTEPYPVVDDITIW